MGQVYRARDTKLKRDVALKILPNSVANDPDRLARFQREAEVLASLNHPNIAHIHGLEDSAGVRALVMELVEGEDLAQRLTRGAIPIEEALPIAKQVADALEAAHEQGIVHRDLKPANIKVRANGTVKVLDFGLAKALDPPASSPKVSQSPTITTPAMTQAGMILGTAAYMSPEQARGRVVDRRCDIWAFGCVLFEMLSGQRAFNGEDIAETIGAVIHKEPDWSQFPGSIPATIRLAIERCLEKDPKRRFRDIGDAQLMLGGAFDLPMPAADTRKRPVSKRAVEIAIAALVAGLATAAVAWKTGRSTPSSPIAKFTLALPAVGAPNAGRHVLALSPDGTQIAVASDRLYRRSLAEFDFQPVAGSEVVWPIQSPAFSPDGRSLTFYSLPQHSLMRIAVGGGTASPVCSITNAPVGINWDASGIIFGLADKGILRCSPDGGQPEQLVTVGPGEFAASPQWLPGGATMLFTLAKAVDGAARWDKAQIVVQTMTTGARKVLASGADARYLPTGYLLYVQDGIVFAAPFDAARQALMGAAVPVVDGVMRTATTVIGSTGMQLSASQNGALVYQAGPSRVAMGVTLALADRAGAVQRLNIPPGPYEHVRASRDGTQLAVGSDDGKEANISICDLNAAGSITRITFGGRNRFPIWSPDGQFVAFQSDREGDLAIFSQRVDGKGRVERLTKPEKGEAHVPESWSKDGVISFSVEKDSTFTLWTVTASDKKAQRFGNVHSAEPIGSVFSPDGGWLAYSENPEAGPTFSSNRGVFVQPYPATNEKHQVPGRDLNFHPVWGPKGTNLFWIPTAGSGQLATVSFFPGAVVPFGNPAFFPARVTMSRTSSQPRAFDILPDERFVGLVVPFGTAGTSDIPQIRVVLNWTEELKQRVTTR
jgi:eukaryotic-like serine/threonine-protein kinase